MKKFVSILMVLALVLSLGVSVFADQNVGSITIANATNGATYEVYKLFDASIKTAADGTTEAVSYTLIPDDPFTEAMFGAGSTGADYFDVNETTGSVTKKEGINDSAMIAYLTQLVEDGDFDAVATIVADEETEVIAVNSYGYYLITSSLGSTVTINSATPHVTVIDKNQQPGAEFKKEIKIGEEADHTAIWGDENTANIGDEITYRISFEATNYDGDKQIKYYQIHDEKGDAIWAEFESFRVFVDGVELDRGYYLSQGGKNTDNWADLGEWAGVAEANRTAANAQWYLVHLTYDTFRITIPWLENHTLETIAGTPNTYNLHFPENPVSKFDSPCTVEITYNAVVEADAAIGATTHGNRYNKAYASWTSENETGFTSPDEVVTYVYGIGLLKDDGTTGVNLAGAQFRIYSDEACTEEVFVIPTNVAGVYIIDSYGTPLEAVSGTEKVTTRDKYAAYLDAYLNGKTQDNLVVSQANGKLAILGLAAGTYYLKEVKAPDGYNALTDPIEIKAGEGTRPFLIFKNDAGEVADIQTENADFKEYRLDLTHTVVHNSKGVVLPSTGGEGTFWLITIGAVLAIGFAVFLVTNKKMSVYSD